jgi:aldose 1-epimerase
MLELNSQRLRAVFSAYGARLVSLIVDGVDVVAGGGNDEEFATGDWTAGAVCGRVAGRIANSRFSLEGRTISLVPNEGGHHLHGGPDNFAVRPWAAQVSGEDVRFSLHSPDGDQGYPGALDVTAAYRLTGSILSLDLEARTLATTIVNLTNHAYWNLSGGSISAFDHEMQIDATAWLPLGEGLLPTGEVRNVEGSRFDFRTLRRIGEPYDNCWCLDGPRHELKRGLVLRDPVSGRRMEVWTSECGMQVYTAAHWNEGFPGRNGPLRQHAATAIEPQNYAGAPSHGKFPSAVLRAGEVYRNRIEWRFS